MHAKTRTKKQYESHGFITQNQQHDLSECYKPTHKILNVSYDTKKCVFILSLQWHTALEK